MTPPGQSAPQFLHHFTRYISNFEVGMQNIEPVWRMEWNESEGSYVPTQELLGYKVVGADGKVLGYGETPSDALEAAYEAMWPSMLQT